MEPPDCLGIRPQDWELLMRLLTQHVPDQEPWVYGSRVGQHAHPLSDLDLVLRNPADLNRPQGPGFRELRAALAESNLPFVVDLHDWARLPAAFQRNIEAQHLPLTLPSERTSTG